MIQGYIQAGRVRSVNPKRRQARVTPVVSYETTFEEIRSVYFVIEGQAPREHDVVAVAEAGSSFVVTLVDTVDFDTVAALRGATLLLPEAAFSGDDDSGWRIETFVGLTVCDLNGHVLGTVTEAYAGPGNDAFAVETVAGGKILLPAIEQVLERVSDEKIVVKEIGPYVVEAS